MDDITIRNVQLYDNLARVTGANTFLVYQSPAYGYITLLVVFWLLFGNRFFFCWQGY